MHDQQQHPAVWNNIIGCNEIGSFYQKFIFTNDVNMLTALCVN